MQLTDEKLTEFQMLHKKHFGTEITKAEAMEKGLRLVCLMEIVLKHETKRQIASENLQSITK